MANSRIPPPTPVPGVDNNLDRVQRALGATVNAVLASPTLDAQVLTGTLVATTAAQALILTHSLNRSPVAALVCACSAGYTLGATGFTPTTASVTMTLSSAVPASVSVVVF